ncbi:MAG: hypothetical protein IJ009_07755 [Clostridia bacterium]|nr:hypothetical protein [Clostridia bacterium]
MTRSEFYAEKSRQRSEFYAEKSRQRSEFYAQKQRERVAARADARRGQIRSRAFRSVSRGGGSIARTFVSSFGTVLEVFLAILLLFGMYNASGGYTNIEKGIVTPVAGVIENASADDEVGVAATNLGYAAVYDSMSGGIGWVKDGNGDFVGRYMTTSSFIDKLMEMDTGDGDNIIDKGLSVLFRNVVNAFIDSPDVPDLSDGVEDEEWNAWREKWESLPVVGGWFGKLFDWVEDMKESNG